MTTAKPAVKSKTPSAASSDAEPEFVLKHRIVGAAFLLFFGALFLPWVLGAPGVSSDLDSSKDSDVGNVATVTSDDSTAQLADELAEALASEQVEVEEQVYISKITPVGVETSNNDSVDAEREDGAEFTAAANDRVEKEAPRAAALTPEAVVDTQERSSEPTTKSPPPTERVAEAEPKIEVGWVVQVGVFTDKKGADRVVADLQSKGFSPSTTIVDTNRGKASGTRIWLGPYAQRVAAAKAKAELNQKTGEAGFIRAYP